MMELVPCHMDLAQQCSVFILENQDFYKDIIPLHIIKNESSYVKVSVTVRGVGMFMRLFEKSYKV